MATESGGSCTEIDSSECKSVNILILGDEDIGKTTLIKSYLRLIGISVEELAIEELDIFVKFPLKMTFKGNTVDVGLIDLYPGANSPERRETYPKEVHSIVLCFSIGQYRTLKSVYNLWIHEVRAHFGKLIPVLLVGLRSDVRFFKPGTLGYSAHCLEENRLVEKCEAEIIHKNYHFHGDYMECSVYDEESVVYVLHEALVATMGH